MINKIIACACGTVEHSLDFNEASVLAFRLAICKKINKDLLCMKCFTQKFVYSRQGLRDIVDRNPRA